MRITILRALLAAPFYECLRAEIRLASPPYYSEVMFGPTLSSTPAATEAETDQGAGVVPSIWRQSKAVDSQRPASVHLINVSSEGRLQVIVHTTERFGRKTTYKQSMF